MKGGFGGPPFLICGAPAQREADDHLDLYFLNIMNVREAVFNSSPRNSRVALRNPVPRHNSDGFLASVKINDRGWSFRSPPQILEIPFQPHPVAIVLFFQLCIKPIELISDTLRGIVIRLGTLNFYI